MLYAIGDIHGCFDKFISLYNKIIYDINKHKQKSTIIFLGDYIDRGLQTKKVLDFLMLLKDTDQIKYIFLKGNHEDMFIDAYYCKLPAIISVKKQMYFANGGIETMNSLINDSNPDTAFNNKNIIKYLNWMEKLKLYHIINDYLFVHAGYNPNYPIEEQTSAVFLWIRAIKSMQYYKNSKYIVIHGHTITKSPIVKINQIGIDTGSFLNNGQITGVKLPDDSELYNVLNLQFFTS
jgi:serine/threonine protein phosphatase 1